MFTYTRIPKQTKFIVALLSLTLLFSGTLASAQDAGDSSDYGGGGDYGGPGNDFGLIGEVTSGTTVDDIKALNTARNAEADGIGVEPTVTSNPGATKAGSSISFPDILSGEETSGQTTADLSCTKSGGFLSFGGSVSCTNSRTSAALDCQKEDDGSYTCNEPGALETVATTNCSTIDGKKVCTGASIGATAAVTEVTKPGILKRVSAGIGKAYQRIKGTLASWAGDLGLSNGGKNYTNLADIGSVAGGDMVPLAGGKFLFEDIILINVDTNPGPIDCNRDESPYAYRVMYDARYENDGAVKKAHFDVDACGESRNREYLAGQIAEEMTDNRDFESLSGSKILPLISFNGSDPDKERDHASREVDFVGLSASASLALFDALPASGEAPLYVGFVSAYGDKGETQPSFVDGRDTMIDFGDGSEPVWLQCPASDATINFGSTDNGEDYLLSDVMKVTYMTEGLNTMYAVTLNDLTMRTVEVGDNPTVAVFNKAFTDSGYVGDVQELTGRATFAAKPDTAATDDSEAITTPAGACAQPIITDHTYEDPGTYVARVIKRGGLCSGSVCPVKDVASVTISVGDSVATNDISFEARVTDVSGAVVREWGTGDVLVAEGDNLHFRWNAPGYQKCLPFFADNGTYVLNHGRLGMLSGNTADQKFDVRERAGEYRLECARSAENDKFTIDSQSIYMQDAYAALPYTIDDVLTIVYKDRDPKPRRCEISIADNEVCTGATTDDYRQYTITLADDREFVIRSWDKTGDEVFHATGFKGTVADLITFATKDPDATKDGDSLKFTVAANGLKLTAHSVLTLEKDSELPVRPVVIGTIDWGDDRPTKTVSKELDGRVATDNSTHTYAEAGTYKLTLTGTNGQVINRTITLTETGVVGTAGTLTTSATTPAEGTSPFGIPDADLGGHSGFSESSGGGWGGYSESNNNGNPGGTSPGGTSPGGTSPDGGSPSTGNPGPSQETTSEGYESESGVGSTNSGGWGGYDSGYESESGVSETNSGGWGGWGDDSDFGGGVSGSDI